VVGEINLSCTKCEWCLKGLGRHCPTRTVLGIVKHPGAFREIFTLPERNLHLVPDTVSTEAAVFTEPLAAACEILDQVAIPPDALAAVLGDGKLGLLISQVLKANGLRVRLYGRHPEKLKIAAAAGVETELAAKLPRAAYDWVVDATGSPEGLQAAAGMTRPRGTVVLKSTLHGAVPLDTAPVIVNELTLIGSRCGRFEPALDLLSRDAVNVRAMVSERSSLSRAAQAFERASQKGVMKVLISPD
jgi:threonine dehydrogenase-like Zn-dependent dehydrogenase